MTKGFDDLVNNVLKPIGGAIAANGGGNGVPGSSTTPGKPAGYFPSSGFDPAGLRPSYKPKPVPKPKPKPGARGSHSPAPPRPSGISPRSNSGNASGGVSGAPKAPSRPKTFTDASGKVRPVAPIGSKTRTVTRSGTKKTTSPAAAAVDPLSTMVDQIIAGMNAPLTAQQQDAEDQARGVMDQNHRLTNTYENRVGGLKASNDTALANAVQKAAELRGLSADSIAKNHAYLVSLMGADNGSGGAQLAQQYGDRTAADLGAQVDSLTSGIKDSGQRTSDYLTASQASGAGWEREQNYQAQLAQRAQQKQLQDQISANTGQRSKMLYDMQSAQADQALKQQVAEQAFGLDKAKFDSSNYFQQANLDLNTTKAQNADKLAQQRIDAAANKTAAPGIYGNIPKRYDKVINSVYSDVNKQMNHVDKNGAHKPLIDDPWGYTMSALADRLPSPNAAAILASKWFPPKKSGTDPKGFLGQLRSANVSDAVAKMLVTREFGAAGWKKANSKGALGDAVAGLGASTAHLGSILGA